MFESVFENGIVNYFFVFFSFFFFFVCYVSLVSVICLILGSAPTTASNCAHLDFALSFSLSSSTLSSKISSTFSSIIGTSLAESPLKSESRKDLREQLNNKPSGGIIFTTIHKFGLDKGEEKFPTLTDRHNVVVICDEAHRTQYGFKGHVDKKTGEIKYGLAKSMRDALPNATFVAFTGTPISKDDRDTQSVFGKYVSIYDIQQAVEDGATVPIYYESRLAKISLKENEVPIIDEKVEEIFDDSVDDDREKERAKSRWAQLEAVVGAEPRIKQITEDLIKHFDTRTKTNQVKQ